MTLLARPAAKKLLTRHSGYVKTLLAPAELALKT
jgi:hypothetical protein